MKHRGFFVLATLLLFGCDGTPVAPTVDYGSCVPTQPSSVEVGGVRFSVAVDPEIMGYRSPTLLTVTLTNTTSDWLQAGNASTCLVEKWVQGESLVPETSACWVPSFEHGPGGSTSFSQGLSLRPPGAPRRQFREDPVDHYMGPEAPPATYCIVASIALDGDTVHLEAPFQLID